jgi:hypothetical protein
MAIFIPEWVRLSGRNLHIKRVFSALDDAFVIRRPLRPERCAADFFVQHADKGWLALAVETQAFAAIGTAQLFGDADLRVVFEQRLAALLRLGERSTSSTSRASASAWCRASSSLRSASS